MPLQDFKANAALKWVQVMLDKAIPSDGTDCNERGGRAGMLRSFLRVLRPTRAGIPRTLPQPCPCRLLVSCPGSRLQLLA